jgi:hypothetical protein
VTNKNKQPSVGASAQVAELLASSRFRRIRDQAFEQADDDGDLYSAWRQNTDRHLGRLAQVIVGRKDAEQGIWDVQRDIALATLNGESLGPYSNYFFHATLKGKPIEAKPGAGLTVADLPNGEYDVVKTNHRIIDIARDEDDPLTFLGDSLEYVYARRQGSERFEGPENYATALKLFTDKTMDIPLEGYEDMDRAHTLMNSAVGNFLRISEKDEPNVIEMQNVLLSIRNLPNGLVDKQFTPGILKHTLKVIDDFGDNGMNFVLGAMTKMDFEECPEAAAMTADLVLRKGANMHRSGDMLTALRAVARLPKSGSSEHAVTTFFDVRNNLEVAGDIPQLVQLNRLLLTIVKDVTENPADSKRAKATAEYVARKASDILDQATRSRSANPVELERLKTQVHMIVQTAKQI